MATGLRLLSILLLNWPARASRSQKDVLGPDKEPSLKMGGEIDKISVFCHYGGSKWHINYSYACSNWCVRVIYASFDPPLEIVSVEDIYKYLYPKGPSDKNFFWVYTNMYISSYWLMCIRSRWSVTLSRVCIYILGLILPDFVFRKNPEFDWNNHFCCITVFLREKYENWILWSLASSWSL